MNGGDLVYPLPRIAAVIYTLGVSVLFQCVFCQVDLYGGDCGGNLGPNPSYATRPKSLRYCMGLL